MIFYHFTSRVHIGAVAKEGISLGSVPDFVQNKLALRYGWQWVTTNKSFDQAWHNPKETSLSYDRTEFRITINIPRLHMFKLKPWIKVCRSINMRENLASYGDSENWKVFRGTIPTAWFERIDRKP